MASYSSIIDMIGATPLLELRSFRAARKLPAAVYGKCEGFNPGGSIKDRAALAMLEQAERDGLLRADTVIIEPTSGNTGIGLAWLTALAGRRLILTMPETMSVERRKLLAAYGAELVLTPAEAGMQGAVRRAQQLAAELPSAFIPDQFANPANAAAHYRGTAPEILADCPQIDVLLAAIGTGGTISGCGKFFREQRPDVRIIGVEPASSPLLSKGYSGKHNLQGIGANFVPALLDRTVIDDIVTVADDEAYAAGRLLAQSEGLLCGISSGAALAAACAIAEQPRYQGAHIVAILPDGGDKYLSTPLFE
ncbi:MAG: cysteine synthase A [Bacillota bacterium]|nr:cysteine synthase A [Bacillota bacterium]